jgi:hypothetical protein
VISSHRAVDLDQMADAGGAYDCWSSELVEMLFFGYFSCLIVAFTAAAMWLIGSFNNSALPKQHHPRPPIEQTVTPEEIASLHLEVTKEASAAKDDVSSVKHHKRRVFARQRNNYEGRGYGNALGYAAEAQNRPRRPFFNW